MSSDPKGRLGKGVKLCKKQLPRKIRGQWYAVRCRRRVKPTAENGGFCPAHREGANSVNDEMTDEESNRWLDAKFAAVVGRDDVEEFEQVTRAGGFFTKVWYRSLGFDFMAETTLSVGRTRRRLRAVAETRTRCLERLTEYLLEYQHPTGQFRTKAQMRMFYNREEAQSD